MEADLVSDVQRIAVLRANALGDLVFALPALDALRAAYPGAELTYLGLPWHADFLANRAPVDRVAVVPPAPGIRDASGDETPEPVPDFAARMRETQFDIIVQLHGGGINSNPFVNAFGARVTAGLKVLSAEPLDRWVPYVYYQPEIFRYLEVVALVGALPVGVEPHLLVTAADRAEADAALPSDDDRPIAVLHPGSGDPRRRWPPEKFAAVGDALATTGARVVVSGTRTEQCLVDAVLGAMRRPTVDLRGRLSISGLAGLLARAAVVVSNDSGPLHLASAVGAATVGIFWCGNLINAGPLTRTRHRPAISWRLVCPVCGVDCTSGSCEHRASFVADVPVAEVATSALDLLAGWTCRDGRG